MVGKSSRPVLFYVGLSFLIISALIFFGAVGVCGTSQIRLEDLQKEHDSLNADFDELQAEHQTLSENYTSLLATYADLQAEYDQLQSTKQIDFGNGLLLSDITATGGTVKGKVQNTSDTPMSRVEVLVAYYNQDGSLSAFEVHSISDLFPQEVAEWDTYCYCYPYPASFDVYAVGNRQ